MRAVELLPFRIAVCGDLQLLDAARPTARVGGLEGPQAVLFHPLLEMTNGLLKLLRPDLYPGLEQAVMLGALAPALDVYRLQEPHLLEQFKRADAAVSVQGRLGRLLNAFL